MPLRRVLVFDNRSLLGAGIENLLLRDGSLEVFGTPFSTETALLREIERSRPDLLVLNEGVVRVRGTQLLARLIEFPDLCIVVMSEEEDVVTIYDRRQVPVAAAGDLVAALKRCK